MTLNGFAPDNYTHNLTTDDLSTLVPEPNFYATILLLIPLITICGNMLVVAGVLRERSLQTNTNYFIFSLAVSDFLVALLVMPFAVYVEVKNGKWYLGQTLCNIYIAMDVAASTASILNLMAISVDRFMAVSRPIQYARHKSKRRAVGTICLVWLTSLIIASPILAGINDPSKESVQCEFENPAYTVGSSLVSFFVPLVIMVVLYAVIFKKLKERQRAAMKQKRPANNNDQLVNRRLLAPDVGATLSEGADEGILRSSDILSDDPLRQDESDKFLPTPTTPANGKRDRTSRSSGFEDETNLVTNANQISPAKNDISCVLRNPGVQRNSLPHFNSSAVKSRFSGLNFAYESEPGGPALSYYVPGETIPFIDELSLSPTNSAAGRTAVSTELCRSVSHSGAPQAVLEQLEQFLTPVTSIRRPSPPTATLLCSFCTSVKRCAWLKQLRTICTRCCRTFGKKARRLRGGRSGSQKPRMREGRRDRRERKATQTLAIVMGVFLLCWVPFFTCHLANSICMMMGSAGCISFTSFFLTTWLGYMNSFMNPGIYTIFNTDFRKAFKKILRCR